ncbi:MAG: Crp/Fnr family transcriptional regulator [Bacteroidota bacterium]
MNDAFSPFIEMLEARLPLSEADKRLLQENLRLCSYSKGEFLLRSGEISRAFFYNLSGFIRLFYVRNQIEKTAWFYAEGQFVSAYESYVRQTPSQLNLQAMEDSSVICISMEAAMRLLTHDPKFSVLARIIMEDELIAHQKMVASLISDRPEDRYQALLDENPAIFQRIPQHYIASFIGVTPESLSRIKKRLQNKNLTQGQ